MAIYKLGALTETGDDIPYEYLDVWAQQKTSGPDRIVVAARSHQADLLYGLAECFDEPFLLLYVLVVPRTTHEPGRYQSEHSFTFTQLHQFLTRYAEFLEKDARHNLWIRPESGNGLLVYDRHNVIYAYGPFDVLISKVNSIGFTKTDGVTFNFPHSHHYNTEFDEMETRILSEDTWTMFPLGPGDENPD